MYGEMRTSPATAQPHRRVRWDLGLRPDPSPKASPTKTASCPGATSQHRPVPRRACGKASAGCGTSMVEYIGSVLPCLPHASNPSVSPYWRRKPSMVGQSQHACHGDMPPPHKSHTSVLSSQASAHRDRSHPLAELDHAGPVAALSAFFTGANSGVAVKAAYAGRCLAASFQVHS